MAINQSLLRISSNRNKLWQVAAAKCGFIYADMNHAVFKPGIAPAEDDNRKTLKQLKEARMKNAFALMTLVISCSQFARASTSVCIDLVQNGGSSCLSNRDVLNEEQSHDLAVAAIGFQDYSFAYHGGLRTPRIKACYIGDALEAGAFLANGLKTAAFETVDSPSVSVKLSRTSDIVLSYRILECRRIGKKYGEVGCLEFGYTRLSNTVSACQ